MPTALLKDPYRFFFYAGDRDEPPHIHIERDACKVKFWLDPVLYDRSIGFSRTEINRIFGLVQENRELLLRSWDEYLND